MKITLTQQDIEHLRSSLKEDLRERAKRVRMCQSTTSDEVLAERIELYNHTQRLINIFTQATSTDIFTDEDDMFTD